MKEEVNDHHRKVYWKLQSEAQGELHSVPDCQFWDRSSWVTTEHAWLVTGTDEIFQIYIHHWYILFHQLYIQFISDPVQHNRYVTFQCSFHDCDGALIKSLRSPLNWSEACRKLEGHHFSGCAKGQLRGQQGLSTRTAFCYRSNLWSTGITVNQIGYVNNARIARSAVKSRSYRIYRTGLPSNKPPVHIYYSAPRLVNRA